MKTPKKRSPSRTRTVVTYVGYARVSTDEQTTAMQRKALKAAGCKTIYEDFASGASTNRPGLARALAVLKKEDVLIVWRLDRLGRSLAHLIELVAGLGARGVGFRSLTEQIDTTTAGGRMIFHIAGAFAQFERDLIQDRTKAGLEAAKQRGVRIGRKPSLTPRQVAHVRTLLETESPAEVARSFNIHRSTLYRHLKRALD